MKEVIIFSTLLFGIFLIAKQNASNASNTIQTPNITQNYTPANLPLTNFKTSKCNAGGMSYSYNDMINKIMGQA